MRRFLHILTVAAGLAGPATADVIGDAAAGETLWARQCQSCHQMGPDAKDRVGPHLNGIFGRRAAAHDGFNYSRPMRRAGADGLTWTLTTLDAYIENPRALVSGTRMSFRGMADATDRANLLAFLRTYSDNPQNIPEAEPTAMQTLPDLSPEVLAIRGDPAFGEYLASECTTCHRVSGDSTGIPAINGWPQEDFVVAMHAYKKKLRPHPVMQMMAGRLADEEIAALAAYFETLGN